MDTPLLQPGMTDRPGSRGRESVMPENIDRKDYKLDVTVTVNPDNEANINSTQHNSGGKEVTKYTGTWVRQKVLGIGHFGAVYLEKHTSTEELRAVKQLMKGAAAWHDREIDCMILVKNVN